MLIWERNSTWAFVLVVLDLLGWVNFKSEGFLSPVCGWWRVYLVKKLHRWHSLDHLLSQLFIVLDNIWSNHVLGSHVHYSSSLTCLDLFWNSLILLFLKMYLVQLLGLMKSLWIYWFLGNVGGKGIFWFKHDVLDVDPLSVIIWIDYFLIEIKILILLYKLIVLLVMQVIKRILLVSSAILPHSKLRMVISVHLLLEIDVILDHLIIDHHHLVVLVLRVTSCWHDSLVDLFLLALVLVCILVSVGLSLLLRPVID